MSDCIFKNQATIISEPYDFCVSARVAVGAVLLLAEDGSDQVPTDEDRERPIDFATWRKFAAAVEEQIQAYERARAEATR